MSKGIFIQWKFLKVQYLTVEMCEENTHRSISSFIGAAYVPFWLLGPTYLTSNMLVAGLDVSLKVLINDH